MLHGMEIIQQGYLPYNKKKKWNEALLLCVVYDLYFYFFPSFIPMLSLQNYFNMCVRIIRAKESAKKLQTHSIQCSYVYVKSIPSETDRNVG